MINIFTNESIDDLDVSANGLQSLVCFMMFRLIISNNEAD